MHTLWSIISPKGEWDYVTWRKMEGTRDNHVKQNKSNWERQMCQVLSHMQNLDLTKKKKGTWTQKGNCELSTGGSCNPSYSGGRDQEDRRSTVAWTNSSPSPILQKPFTEQGRRSGSGFRSRAQAPVLKKKKKKKRTIEEGRASGREK
jgi:hypothetical protein